MHRTSCGPSGTHTRPRGDVLPHRGPCVHDTSSIRRSTLSTNQEQARGSKGPQPRDNGLETPQTPPYPPWDPPGSHLDANRRVQSCLLMVYIRSKLHMDLQADKSPVVVKGPFFPPVVNPMYRIYGTMCNARIQSSKARKAIF
jgi:hypothetical protein